MRYLVIAVVAIAAACTPPRKIDAPPPPTDATRLSHAQHAQVACADCHRGAARPGSDDHRPCDEGACHRAAFTSLPGRLCEVCHTSVTAAAVTAPITAAVAAPVIAPLRPYPAQDAWRAQPSRFSHRRHLAAAVIEARVGFHVTCTDCHTADGAGLHHPDHAACARCHAAEVALTGAPQMADCRACHEPTDQLRTRRRLIRDDLHFDHVRHLTDRRGRPIACDACHRDTVRADGYRDHAAPRVESCVGCHDDSDRTPAVMRMRICQTCHRALSERVTSLAPRSHLPLTERPLDHTLAFRRDHAGAAERDATRCAACHTQMSGNARQACDECHQTMSPADHHITWRELDHGGEAIADRERCATCHVVEFCTSCHAQRPRSHGFPGAFWTEHGRTARIDIRRCITCHQDSFCADCHNGATPRRAR